jgi:hypothetical protein
MPRLDSSENSNNVEYWTDNGYSTNDLNNPYQFDHLHKYWSSVEDNKSAEDLDSNTVGDANNAVYKDKDADADPLPVCLIIEANLHPNQLVRLTVKCLFINHLQGFATTQRTVLEHRIRHLNLLAI